MAVPRNNTHLETHTHTHTLTHASYTHVLTEDPDWRIKQGGSTGKGVSSDEPKMEFGVCFLWNLQIAGC